MKRIVIHWTAGTHDVSALDKKHYHFIIAGNGDVVSGDLPPEANESTQTAYAAHTRKLNTGSIGVAVAAMHNARESPFSAGNYPITPAQVDALAELCADLCETYDIPVTPQTVLTHAEVQPNLGVAQRGKWDITWLPSMDGVRSPQIVGNVLRTMIMEKGVVLTPIEPVGPALPPVAARPAPPAAVPSQAAQVVPPGMVMVELSEIEALRAGAEESDSDGSTTIKRSTNQQVVSAVLASGGFASAGLFYDEFKMMDPIVQAVAIIVGGLFAAGVYLNFDAAAKNKDSRLRKGQQGKIGKMIVSAILDRAASKG